MVAEDRLAVRSGDEVSDAYRGRLVTLGHEVERLAGQYRRWINAGIACMAAWLLAFFCLTRMASPLIPPRE